MHPCILVLSLYAVLHQTPEIPNPLGFERRRIGDGIYEACSAFDVNNDGALDIVHGEYWYKGPDFKQRYRICTLKRVDDYYDDFSCYPMDVNGDGYLDIISGGWWGETLLWRENPKGGEGPWPEHPVAKVGNIERNCFYDIDGDGYVEIFSTTKPIHFFQLVRDAQGKGTGTFKQYTVDIGTGGHGFGVGDINADGRPDMVLSEGWLEAPQNPFDTRAWVWHPEFALGAASVPILVYDVNQDGKNDLIVGQAHGYGLAWYEQQISSEGQRNWVKHEIETDRSQFHDLLLADMDKDGQPELITGKRYRAHNEHDPGAKDPLGLYMYKIRDGKFERMTLNFGPPEYTSGTGIYMWVEDVDHNGWLDLLAPGKEGLYLFLNLGIRETMYIAG